MGLATACFTLLKMYQILKTLPLNLKTIRTTVVAQSLEPENEESEINIIINDTEPQHRYAEATATTIRRN